MGIGLTAPVHMLLKEKTATPTGIKPRGGQTGRRVGPGGKEGCIQYNHGKCSYGPRCNFQHVCLLCLQPTPGRIIASSRRQPSRNRISGSQWIRYDIPPLSNSIARLNSRTLSRVNFSVITNLSLPKHLNGNSN